MTLRDVPTRWSAWGEEYHALVRPFDYEAATAFGERCLVDDVSKVARDAPRVLQ